MRGSRSSALRTGLLVLIATGLVGVFGSQAMASELVQMIQRDLAVLGYDIEAADGELNIKTQLAIGRFEEANEMEVTGQPSIAVAAAASNQADALRESDPGLAQARQAALAAVSTREQRDQERLECLQRVAAQRQQQQQRSAGLGSLVRSGANIAGRFGGGDMARSIEQIARTAEDVNTAAQDLGLSPEQAAECD